MEPSTPPWRVFEAPPASESTDSEPPATATASSRGATAIPHVQPTIIAAFAAAAVLLAAAAAIALGSIGGTTVAAGDGGSADPVLATGPDAGAIVVAVAGAVARPGVYHLSPGSRVADAIAAAGGYGPRVAADRVDTSLNLAAIVHDGDRVVVPSRDAPATNPSGGLAGSGSGPGSGGKPGPALIDLNHATAEELDSLPGVGPVTAQKIIDARTEKPFASIEELRDRGIVGQKAFDKLKALITVG